MKKSHFKKGDRVKGEFGDEGVIERVLGPSQWVKDIRYLVRFVHEYDGKKQILKFQYRERELVKYNRRR